MITKAIIKELPERGDNTFKVLIPIFNQAGINDTAGNLTNTLYNAILCYQPGNTEGYNIDDVVFVSFEDNEYENVVILGKLYTGINQQETTTYSNNNSLKVSQSAVLPEDTKIGNVTAKELTTIRDIIYNGTYEGNNGSDIDVFKYKTEIDLTCGYIPEEVEGITNVFINFYVYTKEAIPENSILTISDLSKLLSNNPYKINNIESKYYVGHDLITQDLTETTTLEITTYLENTSIYLNSTNTQAFGVDTPDIYLVDKLETGIYNHSISIHGNDDQGPDNGADITIKTTNSESSSYTVLPQILSIIDSNNFSVDSVTTYYYEYVDAEYKKVTVDRTDYTTSITTYNNQSIYTQTTIQSTNIGYNFFIGDGDYTQGTVLNYNISVSDTVFKDNYSELDELIVYTSEELLPEEYITYINGEELDIINKDAEVIDLSSYSFSNGYFDIKNSESTEFKQLLELANNYRANGKLLLHNINIKLPNQTVYNRYNNILIPSFINTYGSTLSTATSVYIGGFLSSDLLSDGRIYVSRVVIRIPRVTNVYIRVFNTTGYLEFYNA